MITNYVLKEMGEHITRYLANYRGEALPRGIIFVDGETAPKKDYFCIITKSHLADYAKEPESLDETFLFMPRDPDTALKLPALGNVALFETDLETIPLYNKLQHLLEMLGSTAPVRTQNRLRFSDFIHDVVSMNITRQDEIVNHLRRFPNVNDQVFRVLVFEFDDPESTEDDRVRLIRAVQKAFIFSNSASYFGQVVTLAQGSVDLDDRVSMVEKRQNALREICEKHRCCCGVSDTTKNFTAIRTDYLTARSVLTIGKEMRNDPAERVFFVQDYLAYSLLDTCYHEFERVYRHSSYIYLLHPGLAALIRYDTEHKTELRQLLYCYLQHERNLTKTAAAMSMHRNTVIYKVKKIEEVIEVDLDDPMVRYRMLTSCMLCDYCEKALGIPPTTLPGYIPQA